MSLAEVILVIIWLGVSAYGVFGGADFGAGIWDLLAGGPQKGFRVRALLERSIGPVWEANHVWLIFVLVVLWTAFPTAFASITSTLFIPLTTALIVDYALMGLFTTEVIQLGLWALAPMLAAIVVGEWAYHRIPQAHFRRAVWTLLLVGGVVLTARAALS